MKHLFKTAIVIAIIASSFVTLSSFLNKKASTTASPYSIVLVSKNTIAGITEWTWSVTNPNPGNGDNGTCQDISNWSVPLSETAELDLASAFYSFDGITWFSTSPTVDRNPSIRVCSTTDVLKFDVGTTGATPTYYRACFTRDYSINAFAQSFIKTGGGLEGCNDYFFCGLGSRLD